MYCVNFFICWNSNWPLVEARNTVGPLHLHNAAENAMPVDKFKPVIHMAKYCTCNVGNVVLAPICDRLPFR